MTEKTFTLTDLVAEEAWTRRLVQTLAGGRDVGDDVLQETWIAAARRPPGADRPLRAWLTVVVRNFVRSRVRSEERRDAREQAALDAVGATDTPEELVARAQARRLLAEMVLEIEEPYRQTLLLRYYEGRSAAEISRLQGVPAGTVRWRLKTALDQLRRRLDERHGGDRDSWLGLLAPLAERHPTAVHPGAQGPSPVAGSSKVGSAIKGAIVLAIVVPVVWVVQSRRGGPEPHAILAAAPSRIPAPATRGAGSVASAALPNSTGATGNAPPVPAAADLSNCVDRLRQLRQEAARREVELIELANPKSIFAAGEPNPTARTALLPIVQERMRAFEPNVPAYRLECRTWACLLHVFFEVNGDTIREWMEKNPTAEDWTLGGRARGVISSYDHVEKGQLLAISLVDRSGAPGRREIPPAADPRWQQTPLPATLSACRQEVEAVGRTITFMTAAIETDMPLSERFARSPPNVDASAELGDLFRRFHRQEGGLLAFLRRLFGLEAPIEVECRGRVCRIDGSTIVVNRILARAEIRARIGDGGGARGADVAWIQLSR